MTSDARCRSLRRGRGRGRDGLDFFFVVPRRFDAPRQRFGWQGGTSLQASVALDGVFAVVFSANVIFFDSARLPCWAVVTSDTCCQSLCCGCCRGRDGLVYLFGFPRRFEVPLQGIGCQGGTGLQALDSHIGVFTVVIPPQMRSSSMAPGCMLGCGDLGCELLESVPWTLPWTRWS